MSEKTEEATPRRLKKAREEGDSGASTFGAQALGFVAAAAIAPAAVRALMARAAEDLRVALSSAGAIPAAAGPRGAAASLALRTDSGALAMRVVELSAPVLVAAGVVGAAAMVVQTGGIIATKRISLDLTRLDPVSGVRSMFSAPRLFAVARALLAGGAVAWLTFEGLLGHLVDLARASGRVAWAAVVAGNVVESLAWRAALLGVALGVADALFTKKAWLRKLRMSKEEIRREYKDAEGDPQVKAARERAHREILTQSAVANVRTASVVVVNPTHLACALRYDQEAGDRAPVVVACGEGDVAACIARAAREYGVPVVRDVPLARALMELQVGDAIPEALYEAVAVILGEVWESEPPAPPK